MLRKLKNAPSERTNFKFHGSGEICEKSTYKALYLNKRVVDIPPFDEKNFYELWPNWIPTPHRVLANGFDDLADKENPSQCGPTFYKVASNISNIHQGVSSVCWLSLTSSSFQCCWTRMSSQMIEYYQFKCHITALQKR